ncbi:hypothetical protein BGZ94_003470 [Podila epigama]|nr:hypothetical protein BGZ94_003470 [Podila epigama]
MASSLLRTPNSSHCSATSSLSSSFSHCHSRSNSTSSTDSLLYTPPLSPTEEQLLAFLIPDIEPAELAAYLSAPTTPVLNDVSCLIEQSYSSVSDSTHNTLSSAETVYPSPVCAAAAATVVAVDRLDAKAYPSLGSSPSSYDYHTNTNTLFESSSLARSRKRCSTYAFMDDDDQEDALAQEAEKTEFLSTPVFVMSSRNTRKRLMLEQAFVSPDDESDELALNNISQDCYDHLFNGVSISQDSTLELSNNLAFDLVLV